MIDNRVKRRASEFYRSLNTDKVTFAALSAAVEIRGYTLIEFSEQDNDYDVTRLLNALSLLTYAETSRGFTYTDKKYRLIFVHRDLSDNEKCIVLAHEIGHIVLNHIAAPTVLGKDVEEEYEANEFAHYLLKNSKAKRFSAFFRKNKKAVLAVFLAVVLLTASFTVYGVISHQGTYHGEYYVTATGEKYHKKECIFIKNKTNTRRLTQQEWENGDYAPCDICLPDVK